jgi:hypothetical protein
MKAKEIVMIIALSVLTSLFFGLLVDALYEEPKYEDFCSQEFFPRIPVSKETKECVFQPLRSEETEINKCYKDGGQPDFNYDEYGCQQGFKSCNFCNKEFDTARAMYNRNVFFIIAPIGLILLISGLILGYEVVGTGLMFSGILLIAYATIRYFSDMSKLFRAFVIFAELVLLIIISIKKLKK